MACFDVRACFLDRVINLKVLCKKFFLFYPERVHSTGSDKMGKKTAILLAMLLMTVFFSTSSMAAPSEDKGKPEKVDGVITKPNGDAINTGKSDQKPGPSPT